MVKSLLMIFFSISLAVGGQLLLKSGMNSIGRLGLEDLKSGGTILSVATNVQVISGLVVYFMSAMIWLIVLSREDLSFAYPLLGTSYVFVLFASRIVFQEPINALRWGGAILISLGVFFITRT